MFVIGQCNRTVDKSCLCKWTVRVKCALLSCISLSELLFVHEKVWRMSSPICSSLVGLQTELDSTRSYYHNEYPVALNLHRLRGCIRGQIAYSQIGQSRYGYAWIYSRYKLIMHWVRKISCSLNVTRAYPLWALLTILLREGWSLPLQA